MRRRIVVIGAAILFLSPASYALDPIGRPQALLGQGRWGLGVEYSYSETRVALKDGALVGAPIINDSTQLQSHAPYVDLRDGVCNNVDVFTRLGATIIDLPLL